MKGLKPTINVSNIKCRGRICSALTIALFVLALLPVGSSRGQVLNFTNYNAIIFNDYSTPSDVEGRLFVGHDYTNPNQSQVAIHLSNTNPTTDRSFVVGHNIVAGSGAISLQVGSLYIGGTTNSRTIYYNGQGSLHADATISSSLTSIQTYSIQESTALKNMATDSTLVNSGGIGEFRGIFTGDNVAVFNIAGSTFADTTINQFTLTNNGASLSGVTTGNVIINVSGTTINWSSNANMVSPFTDDYWQGHVLWNFYQATSINFGNHGFNGAVLAPLASINTTANIDGLVVANNLTTSLEVHLPASGNDNAYQGYLAPVPEPSGALLICVAGGLAVLCRRSGATRP